MAESTLTKAPQKALKRSGSWGDGWRAIEATYQRYNIVRGYVSLVVVAKSPVGASVNATTGQNAHEFEDVAEAKMNLPSFTQFFRTNRIFCGTNLQQPRLRMLATSYRGWRGLNRRRAKAPAVAPRT